jgi:hypothetical protein
MLSPLLETRAGLQTLPRRVCECTSVGPNARLLEHLPRITRCLTAASATAVLTPAVASALKCCFPIQAVFERILLVPSRCARSRRAAMHPTTLYCRAPAATCRSCAGDHQFFLVLQRNSRTPVHRPSSLPALREPHARAGRRSLAPRGLADDRLGAGKTPPGAPGLGRYATKSCNNILKATDACFFPV